MSIIAISASMLLYQIFWYLFIKEFKVKNIFYLLSVIITGVVLGGYYYFNQNIGLELIPYSLILLILINLSIIDCKYYEIDGKSYWYLLLPTIAVLILSYEKMALHLFSFILIYGIFWLIDKAVGIERIGGADVKILLILSLTITFYDAVLLLSLSFVVDVILFGIKFVINKIRGINDKTKIPMIVSITIAWIITCLMNFAI